MSVTVASVVEIPLMHGTRLVAGQSGITRPVGGIAMMEDLDSGSWLTENSLVISNGKVVGENLDKVRQIVDILIKNNTAGLAFKLGRHISQVPDEMVEYANEKGYPILVLPYRVTSDQIISSISYLLFENETNKRRSSLETELIKDILLEKGSSESLEERIDAMGWKKRGVFGVVVFKFEGDALPNHDDVARVCAGHGFGHGFSMGSKHVAVIEVGGDRQLFMQTYTALTDGLFDAIAKEFLPCIVKVGIGNPKGEVLGLSNSYREALGALCSVLIRKNGMSKLRFSEMGIFGVLLGDKCRVSTKMWVLKIRNAIESFDSQNKATLWKTLEAYADNDQSVALTAKALYIHPNTVRYRLNSIRSILAEHSIEDDVALNLDILCRVMLWLDVYQEEQLY